MRLFSLTPSLIGSINDQIFLFTNRQVVLTGFRLNSALVNDAVSSPTLYWTSKSTLVTTVVLCAKILSYPQLVVCHNVKMRATDMCLQSWFCNNSPLMCWVQKILSYPQLAMCHNIKWRPLNCAFSHDVVTTLSWCVECKNTLIPTTCCVS